MSETGKRTVPSPLKSILKFDDFITKQFVTWGNTLLPLKTLRVHYKGLEISCHGIPWFAFGLLSLGCSTTLIWCKCKSFLDILLVAVAKAYFRRRRPVQNTDDALGQIGPDVFSFPSGHSSRAVFVAYFFMHLWPLPMIFYPPLLAWVTAVCLSRILMNRHYILDVIGGCLLGVLVGFIVGLLWIQDSTARSLLSIVSDEKLDGGDYHV